MDAWRGLAGPLAPAEPPKVKADIGSGEPLDMVSLERYAACLGKLAVKPGLSMAAAAKAESGDNVRAVLSVAREIEAVIEALGVGGNLHRIPRVDVGCGALCPL